MRYSIIIPVRNGLKYLPNCIDSVVSQAYSNFEVIISDNHSTDGTADFLATLTYPNLLVVRPPAPVSMVGNFEFALSKARGDWLTFLGVDDGLQPYFFEFADYLTRMADQKKVRAIMSQRAYYFWPGCERLYGTRAVAYSCEPRFKLLNSTAQALKTMLSSSTYFDLPQMYVSSIVKKDLILEAARINGQVFTSPTPDANLAAIVTSLEHRYLYSSVPLGWIGTSPSSNGFSFTTATASKSGTTNKIVEDFKRLNEKERVKYHERAGNVSLASCVILFWETILQTTRLRGAILNWFYNCRLFQSFVFANALHEIRSAKSLAFKGRVTLLKDIVDKNSNSFSVVAAITNTRELWRFASLWISQSRVYSLSMRLLVRLGLRARSRPRYSEFSLYYDGHNTPSMKDASQKAHEYFQRQHLLDSEKGAQ